MCHSSSFESTCSADATSTSVRLLDALAFVQARPSKHSPALKIFIQLQQLFHPSRRSSPVASQPHRFSKFSDASVSSNTAPFYLPNSTLQLAPRFRPALAPKLSAKLSQSPHPNLSSLVFTLLVADLLGRTTRLLAADPFLTLPHCQHSRIKIQASHHLVHSPKPEPH